MTAIDFQQLHKENRRVEPRSLWADAWRRLRYSFTARIGGVVATGHHPDCRHHPDCGPL